jgi:hypothetical protein
LGGVPSVLNVANMVLLDQLAYVFDSLRRAVGIVAHNEVDLAAIDAALFIYHGEIGRG